MTAYTNTSGSLNSNIGNQNLPMGAARYISRDDFNDFKNWLSTNSGTLKIRSDSQGTDLDKQLAFEYLKEKAQRNGINVWGSYTTMLRRKLGL